MVKRFQDILYIFLNLLVQCLRFFGRDSSTSFWVENVPFLVKVSVRRFFGDVFSHFVWLRFLFIFFLGNFFFSKVVLVELFG